MSAQHINDIVLMDAVMLSRNIHSRQVSCSEVMNAFLDHIERFNPKVNAIVALQERDHLLAAARERDAQLARGESMGPLHGFPHAVKDLQWVKGMRTTMGSPILKDFVAATDGLMVQRLRAAGALFIGKTNTSEFGLGSHTFNPVYGITGNAYEPSRSAGGSSGGAAVSLALRMLPLADGSDYGGSLRNPAGWNGVFGFRTGIGRIPNDAREVWLPSMGVAGPMARSVADLAMLLAVQAGFDARAPLSLDGDGSEFQQPLEKSFQGCRLAWGADFKGHTPCEPAVLELCRAATKILESLGCTVEEAAPDFDFDALWQATIRLRAWQQGASMLPFYHDPAQRALLKPEAIFEIETGLRQSAYDITAASVVRTGWSQTVRRFFEHYDFFILPTAQVMPFDATLRWPQEIAGNKMHTYHEWMKSALYVTMAGCPALAAPAGFSDRGLPMGIQIIAPDRREFSCMQLAYAYESAMNPADKRVPPMLAAAL
ncbi:MAG TPA: amidase [Steroidobacteraceae bacterium]|jgi:amidase|nr:amidase [Steroidobacteraceae bacterium]